MIKTYFFRYVLPIFIIVGIGVLAWRLIYNPVSDFKTSVPGMDERRTGAAAAQKESIGETFIFINCYNSTSSFKMPIIINANILVRKRRLIKAVNIILTKTGSVCIFLPLHHENPCI